jgi:hypothetical protein
MWEHISRSVLNQSDAEIARYYRYLYTLVSALYSCAWGEAEREALVEIP